jgi:protein-tyrosine phosphatase
MMNKVAERLYVGDWGDAHALSLVNLNSIGADLNCSQQSDGHAGFKDIAYCRTDFPDGQAIPENLFWEGIDFLLKEYAEGRNCLVHCAAGVSRSVTMAAAFMQLQGLAPDMDAALLQIKKSRTQAGPSPVVFASAKQYLSKGRP